MTKIEKIDNELDLLFDTLKKETSLIDFETICDFTIDNASRVIPWNDIVFQGVYLIEIKNNRLFDNFDLWVEDFKSKWEDEKYIKKFTPNIKKKRVKAHTELNDWIPLYIGKSKNIGSRIHGHIYKELHKTTFALKLQARENLKNEVFRFKTIRIDVRNYDAIVPRIEWQLRDKINPLIGKQ